MTVGWGVLGAGHMGRHVGWLLGRTPGARVVATGSRSGTPYDEVVADPAVDVVYLALPPQEHLRWALAAWAGGKHVLCEKPLGLTAAEVSAMTAAASAGGGRLLVEASFWRWHPRVALATALLPRVGRVEHVEAGFTFGGAAGWRLSAPGGGALLDVGCYAASAAVWAAGPVAVVSARSRTAAGSAPGAVDLETELACDHVGGATSALHCAIDTTARQWLVVTGTGGELELRGNAFTAGGGTERVTVPGRPEGESGYAEMLAAVTAVVAGGRSWLLPTAESLAVAQVLDAAHRSALSGSPVAA